VTKSLEKKSSTHHPPRRNFISLNSEPSTQQAQLIRHSHFLFWSFGFWLFQAPKKQKEVRFPAESGWARLVYRQSRASVRFGLKRDSLLRLFLSKLRFACPKTIGNVSAKSSCIISQLTVHNIITQRARYEHHSPNLIQKYQNA
jgi:hypothetical protein